MEGIMTTAYRTVVTQLGSEVSLFLTEKMMVIFNETVPPELKDISVVHTGAELHGKIEAGDVLKIDEHSFNILFVGNKANQTIKELGHCTIVFNGACSADQPGTICVEDKEIPEMTAGSKIEFIKC